VKRTGHRPADVKGTVHVVDGVDPHGTWDQDDRGYSDGPVTGPLSNVEIARRFPTLLINAGDQRPRIRGKIDVRALDLSHANRAHRRRCSERPAPSTGAEPPAEASRTERA